MRDSNGNIIGTIGNTVDITSGEEETVRLQLETQAQQLAKDGIFKYLKMIAPIVPANMYWFDLEHKVWH